MFFINLSHLDQIRQKCTPGLFGIPHLIHFAVLALIAAVLFQVN